MRDFFLGEKTPRVRKFCMGDKSIADSPPGQKLHFEKTQTNSSPIFGTPTLKWPRESKYLDAERFWTKFQMRDFSRERKPLGYTAQILHGRQESSGFAPRAKTAFWKNTSRLINHFCSKMLSHKIIRYARVSIWMQKDFGRSFKCVIFLGRDNP